MLAREPRANYYYASLKERAEKIFEASPSFYSIPDPIRSRPHILWISRQVLERVYTLALLYRLDGDQQYAGRAWEELREAASFPDWYPEHFLGTAEMSHAFAIGYDWLYDGLVEDQRVVLRDAIVEKGLKPALERYREQSPGDSWVTAVDNWNLVCNSGVGLGALAIKGEATDFAEEIEETLESAFRSLKGAMSRFAPDGGWREGLTYWSYGTYYVTLFLAASELAQSVQTGLLDSPGFSETGFFPLYLTGPGGQIFNFADSEPTLSPPTHLLWHARKFSHPVYAWYQHQVELSEQSPEALDLLWHTPPDTEPQEINLPLDKHFRGTEIVTFRSEWEDPDALFVGFKAGDNKASHSHLDQGSFVLDALGARWVVDLGAANYDGSGYWDDSTYGQRWTYYRTRAEGHNTLVINPSSGPDQDPMAASSISRFHAEPDRAFAIADLTLAYGEDVHKVWRGIALLNRRWVLVQDEVETAHPAEIWWFMHTQADEISLNFDGTAAILTQGRERVWVSILAPDWATLTSMDARPLPTSPNPPEQGENQGVRKLGINLTGVDDLRLAVLLAPLREGDDLPSDLPEVLPLAEW